MFLFNASLGFAKIKRGLSPCSFNNVTGGVGGGNCNVMNNKTLPRKLNNTSSNGGSSSTFKNGGSGKLTHLNNPLYVSQNSVAVMTSPTFSSQMGRTSFTTNSSLSDTDSSVSASQVRRKFEQHS